VACSIPEHATYPPRIRQNRRFANVVIVSIP
jgi:hypothetical protein